MKRPVVKTNDFRPFFKKRPFLTRVLAFLWIPVIPIIVTVNLWIENWDDIKLGIKDHFEVMIGKWEEK